ncbi:hypothetical protein JKP88DRAFT_351077 [Tribonema minus]|uniref:Thioredoxin domain-containing protein n=1 Tax=Tribonema minus TaxID=303371 RepID=A0A835YMJ9_9STRA|nr:hypothetical protein JKP88DRAFT_351077 [Tribonema minus]
MIHRLAPPLLLAGCACAFAPLTMTTVEVKYSFRSVVDTKLLGEAGLRRIGAKPDLVLLQSIVGKTEDGKEVIGVVEPQTLRKGAKVEVQETMLVNKPQGWRVEESSMLPHLAITSGTALMAAGITQDTAPGKHCAVTGGNSPMAAFMMCLLAGWGASVIAVTNARKEACLKCGASTVVDFRADSFADEAKGSLDLVVDTLGRESKSSIAELKRALGAQYVSVMPEILKLAVDDGVIFGGGKIMAYRSALQGGNNHAFWLPDDGGASMGMVNAVAELSASSPHLQKWGAGAGGSTDMVSMQEYLEALAWPKDRDTGLRYGFPGRTSEYWMEPSAEEVEVEDEQVAVAYRQQPTLLQQFSGAGAGATAGGAAQAAKGGKKGASSKPIGGGIKEVASAADLAAATHEDKAILFVSSGSCRVCKYLGTWYRKLEPQFEDIEFLHMDAQSDPQLVGRQLGLNAVPSFVAFKGGKMLATVTSSDKTKIEELVQKLA